MSGYDVKRPEEMQVGVHVKRVSAFGNDSRGVITQLDGAAGVRVSIEEGGTNKLYHHTHWKVVAPPNTNASAKHLLKGSLSLSIEKKPIEAEANTGRRTIQQIMQDFERELYHRRSLEVFDAGLEGHGVGLNLPRGRMSPSVTSYMHEVDYNEPQVIGARATRGVSLWDTDTIRPTIHEPDYMPYWSPGQSEVYTNLMGTRGVASILRDEPMPDPADSIPTPDVPMFDHTLMRHYDVLESAQEAASREFALRFSPYQQALQRATEDEQGSFNDRWARYIRNG